MKHPHPGSELAHAGTQLQFFIKRPMQDFFFTSEALNFGNSYLSEIKEAN